MITLTIKMNVGSGNRFIPSGNKRFLYPLLSKIYDECRHYATINIKHYCTQHAMMTSSNENIFRVTGHLCGEFTGHREFPAQRPVTRSFDVFYDLRLIKRLSKQWWGWWFETPSYPLWHYCNAHLGGGSWVAIQPSKTDQHVLHIELYHIYKYIQQSKSLFTTAVLRIMWQNCAMFSRAIRLHVLHNCILDWSSHGVMHRPLDSSSQTKSQTVPV